MRILAPHPNTPTPDLKQVLFVLQQGLRKKTAIKNWMQLRHSQVHFRANPRTYNYMLQLARESLPRLAPNGRADMLAFSGQGQELDQESTEWLGEIYWANDRRLETWPEPLRKNLRQGFYDAIILLHTDAIGLGWRPLERALKQFNAPNYWIINGRRRIYRWDAGSRYALAWRRLLARAWPVEMIFGMAVLICAGFLAAYDGLRGKNKGLI